MKRILFISTLALLVAGMSANAPLAQAAEPDHKVVICHVPPGNPDNQHTIVVDAHSLQAHFDHGDYLGECDLAPIPL